MIDQEELKNALIIKLACVGEEYKNNEIKWNSGSKMTRTIEFVDGSISNFMVRYYRKDGSIFSYCEYQGTERHGMYRKYYTNGSILSEAKFSKGKKQYNKEYFISGDIKRTDTYVNGKLHGYSLLYKKHIKKDAKKYGKKYYLYMVSEYRYGKLNGLKCSYYPNGNKQSDVGYKNGNWDMVDYIEYSIIGRPGFMYQSRCSWNKALNRLRIIRNKTIQEVKK